MATTKRAKRMARFLEGNGWSVFTDVGDCPRGCLLAGGGKFCGECGTKMRAAPRTEAFVQLERAIAYALEEG